MPPENIRAGTRPYLDPFLELRKEKTWDVHAERFAAAMTLYEMATGTLPRWGDGRSAAEFTSEEATLAPELFDPSVRDGLASFFSKALRRGPSERYESAEKMLEDWQRIFEHIDRTTSSSEGEIDPAAIEAAVAEARLDSAITLLPFTCARRACSSGSTSIASAICWRSARLTYIGCPESGTGRAAKSPICGAASTSASAIAAVAPTFQKMGA
ncbi:MAG: hypothetical protein JOZ29_09475 [Deltaproteobacteria bacterium]|nr:hypothetical protein [Deltaproteobacteria bacterium]